MDPKPQDPYKPSELEEVNVAFVIALLCGMLKGALTFFNFFKATRYLVKMIITIFVDLRFFLVVLLATNCMFSVFFRCLDGGNESFLTQGGEQDEAYKGVPFSVFKGLLQSWDLMLGYGEYKFRTAIGITFYFLATVFTNIVMLNMVISVVSDTFDKVQMTMKEQENKTRAEMLHEYSQFLSMVQPECEEFGHIYIWRVKMNEDNEEDWTGKVNVVKKVI